jgi:hypothetical protein
MKPSNIPGFTADQSLPVHRERYRAVLHSTPSGSRVVPAIRPFDECFRFTANRTLWRCGQAGFSYEACYGTAIELAESVCQIYADD